MECSNGCCSYQKWDDSKIPMKKFYQNTRRAGAVIRATSTGKILAVQSRNMKWGIPKGKHKEGETDKHCAEREITEETTLSIKVDPEKKINLYSNFTVYFVDLEEERDVDVDLLHFSKEITGIGWFHPSCLLCDFLLNSPSRKMIKKIL